jgi:hypothetical protein
VTASSGLSLIFAAAGSPPITIFLRGASLEPHRINDDVEGDGKGEQRRGRQIERESEYCDGDAGKDESESWRERP